MTNFEKYKEQILEIVDTKDTGIAVCNGVLHSCGDVSCENCDFCRVGCHDCDVRFIRWLFQEYGEKPKLSERAYHFLKSLPDGARIKSSDGFLYINAADEIECINAVDETKCMYSDYSLFIPNLPPSLINDVWYEVSEILKWEVEE